MLFVWAAFTTIASLVGAIASTYYLMRLNMELRIISILEDDVPIVELTGEGICRWCVVAGRHGDACHILERLDAEVRASTPMPTLTPGRTYVDW